MSALRKLWKNSYVKAAVGMLLVVGIVLGAFLSLELALGTAVPLRVVESGSMCVAQPDGECDGWSHPFAQTLHVGDIIVIQAVNPADLNANYPNSDIIVYKKPGEPIPIVHRITEKQEINGTWYFKTKGDGNGPIIWPDVSDSFDVVGPNGVSQDLVEGKVVMHIPYLGLIPLFVRSNPWGLPAIVALIALVIIIEFVVPAFRAKRKTAQQKPAM